MWTQWPVLVLISLVNCINERNEESGTDGEERERETERERERVREGERNWEESSFVLVQVTCPWNWVTSLSISLPLSLSQTPSSILTKVLLWRSWRDSPLREKRRRTGRIKGKNNKTKKLVWKSSNKKFSLDFSSYKRERERRGRRERIVTWPQVPSSLLFL